MLKDPKPVSIRTPNLAWFIPKLYVEVTYGDLKVSNPHKVSPEKRRRRFVSLGRFDSFWFKHHCAKFQTELQLG